MTDAGRGRLWARYVEGDPYGPTIRVLMVAPICVSALLGTSGRTPSGFAPTVRREKCATMATRISTALGLTAGRSRPRGSA